MKKPKLIGFPMFFGIGMGMAFQLVLMMVVMAIIGPPADFSENSSELRSPEWNNTQPGLDFPVQWVPAKEMELALMAADMHHKRHVLRFRMWCLANGYKSLDGKPITPESELVYDEKAHQDAMRRSIAKSTARLQAKES